MTFLLASVPLDTVGTALAGLIASGASVAAYRTQLKLRKTDNTAELARVETEGWKTLIDSLMEQYKAATEELGQAKEQHRRVVDSLEARIVVTEALLRENNTTRRALVERIEVLSIEVVRLGGDLDRLLGGPAGPAGAPGPAGPAGERGAQGERGAHG